MSSVSAIPRLALSASPQVSSSADVHEFSLVEGDVQIESGVMIAPGTAVTAEQGAAVRVSERCSLLPGVVIEAIAGPSVVEPASSKVYSVYVGDSSVVAHKALIHSPAFIGKDCFVGFRSTIFNARIGDGCVILMHALVQDVEIPPGRCVPSGAVINSQHQADQLPKVRPEDLEFASEITGGSSTRNRIAASDSRSSSHRSSSHHNQSRTRLVSVHSAADASRRSPSNRHSSSSYLADRDSSSNQAQTASRAGQSLSSQFSSDNKGATMQAQRLSSEIVQQVRQHLSAGYRIGMEHADTRRYRSGVWETCTPIKDTREQAVFEALERCLAEHQGEYVRMFGIDPKAKKRVGMITVQRPGDKPAERGSAGGSYGSQTYSSQGHSSNGNSGRGNGGLDAGVAQKVRNLLNAGYQIGTEHASPRHYRSNVWKVCSPIESRNEREVFAKLEHCLDEHSGEYIRMFGINAKAKSRTATTTIQRADGKPVEVSAQSITSAGSASSNSSSSSASSYGQTASASDETAQVVSQIIRGGSKVGIEFADKRRYRSGIWQTAPSINASSESAAISQLQSFLSQHADKYVRVFGVDAQSKTRGPSTTVQKPGQSGSRQSSGSGSGVSTSGREAARSPINENPPHYDDPAFRGQSNGGGANGAIDSAAIKQITNLVNQGHKLSLEFADKRRFRSGIWKTGATVSSRRPAEAISEIGKQLARHSNDYVRLVATDDKAKRRVSEITVQRPGQKPAQGGNAYGSGSGRRDPINANPPHYDDPAFRGEPSSYGQSGGYNSNGQSGSYNTQTGGYDSGNNGSIQSAVLDQVTQLINQGHKISLEYADKRRYRSGIWKTGSAIAASRPAEAISEVGKQLAQHQGEYVRLVGVDPTAKRRVLEATIQRP